MAIPNSVQKHLNDLRESVNSNDKERSNVMISKKVKKYLKDKYGTTSAGINTLALKDMGEL